MSEILEEILKKYAEKDQALIQRAFTFAKEAHSGQKRENGDPYMTHPLSVAEVLSHIDLDAETIVAALLHDVLEDTPTTKDRIEELFGETVAFLVSSLTGLEQIDYRQSESENEKQRQKFIENFRKMLFATAKDIRVLIIKLADVLHNTQTIKALPKKRQKRYAQEVLDVYAPIAARLGIGWLKGELEDRAFAIVYPAEYKKLKERIANSMEENKRYIEELKPLVVSHLKDEEIDNFSIDARTKHFYSLWKKLKRYNNDLSRIYDLVALRIIVPSVSDCYEVLGIIHEKWKPLPGRVKDYIALPKPNGYRSLHTTVFSRLRHSSAQSDESTQQNSNQQEEDSKITEFQIRTPEMHHEAEMGVAAHWTYKEDLNVLEKNIGWIKQLREWQNAVDADELLESLKIDFFQDRIFVFTPKGDVVNLPRGATPIDFAYAIHSEIGDHAQLAKVNGKAVQLDTQLKNNNMVEIITAKNKKPSRNWLDFVKTSKARTKIRNALRKNKSG